MSRFEKFRVDEVSIDDAEEDICFNAKDAFEECTNVCLFGLRFTEDENTNEWEKRKVEYTPASPLPIEFQELLNGDFGSSLSFLFALHPQNINKEIMTVIGSAHIFADKKPLRKKLHSTLHNWFFNPEVFKKQAEYKSDNKEQTPTIELGFIEKLVEMFKYRRILRDFKQDIEQQNGLSNGYVRTEGKLVVDLMLTYRSTHLQ